MRPGQPQKVCLSLHGIDALRYGLAAGPWTTLGRKTAGWRRDDVGEAEGTGPGAIRRPESLGFGAS
ncbi:hypothetical protein CBM2586_A50394 [Cupriavidus phytorum]|uniref:Uncharacterized protein n=1 Tax=Cupriavidus taiwanensis TaxID=164546 RepID=A0A375C3C4_9BURK|nr:hypothetical protein CBM2586_A50394 [Cupriavidus taiwanensis]